MDLRGYHAAPPELLAPVAQELGSSNLQSPSQPSILYPNNLSAVRLYALRWHCSQSHTLS